MKLFFSIIIFFALIGVNISANAQDDIQKNVIMVDSVENIVIDDEKVLADTISIINITKNKKGRAKRDWSTWRPSSKKATWIAVCIPGGGQIYNRKYWKLPLVYGGFMGCAYAWRWNGQMYKDYAQAYLDIMDDDPETNSYEQFMHLGAQITESNLSRYQSLFQKRKDRFRRYRDLSIFCMIGVYALSVIDAYVDASLSEFDISDDLSMKISPAIFMGKGKEQFTASHLDVRNASVGINCCFNF